jgi:hypothetical protein
MYYLRLLAVICFFFIPFASIGQDSVIVLKGGTIVDVENFGKSARDIKNAVVVVRNGKIVSAGAAEKIAIPKNATVIDATGKFIVPGLIEGFGSVTNQAFANAYLYLGVTTVCLVEDNRRGKTFYQASPSPALYLQESFYGCDRVESNNPNRSFENVNYRNDAQIAHEIDSMTQLGARIMLVHYGVKKEQLPAIVAACKKNKLAMIGELGYTSYEDAVKAGINTFVHTTRYTADILPDSVREAYANAPFGPPGSFFYQYIQQGNLLQDAKLKKLAELYGKNIVGLIPTASLLVYSYSPFAKNIWEEPAAAIINEKDILHEPLDKKTGKHLNPPPHRAKVAPLLLAVDSFFAKNNARFLAGSGATAFGTLPGISLHTELEMLSRAGLTNRQVLAAATNNFSLLWNWKHIGKIEAGRDADILVLTGDPTKSIENLKKIDVLMVKGRLVDRKELLIIKL